MAGGIVGVEPLDLPGAYRAKMADGSSMMVHGPAGEELARRYANTGMNATGPNALAERVGKTVTAADRPDMASDAVPAMYGQQKLPGGGASMPIAQARATQQASAVAAPEGGTQQAGPAAAPAPSQAGPLGYTMKGLDASGKEIAGPAVRREDGSIGIYVAPVAGRAGGMTKLGKEAVQHTGEAEAEAARQNALSEISRQRGVDAALDESAEREGYLIEQQKQNLMAAQQQQDEIDKQTAAVDKLQAGYQVARDDFMNSKVDPDQYIKSDKARGIFSMLGVMLNQFGSAFTHQPNVAADFVNSQIDRNIRAQETAINVKGKAADNMLSDLTRQTGDLKLAKVAMKQMLTERATVEAQRIGMGAKNQAIKANASEVASKLAAQTALQDNARKQGFVEHVMTNPLYYQRGSAGRSGGFVQPTQESVQSAAASGIAAERLAVDKAKAEAEKNGAGQSPVSSDRVDKITSFANAVNAAGAVKKELLARGVTGDATDDPTAGVIDRLSERQSNELINQNSTELAKGLQSAFGKSDRDAEDAQRMAEGGGSGRDRYQAAERNEKKLIKSLRAELSALPPAQAQKQLETMDASVKAKILGQE